MQRPANVEDTPINTYIVAVMKARSRIFISCEFYIIIDIDNCVYRVFPCLTMYTVTVVLCDD